jgi:hypothetical protein
MTEMSARATRTYPTSLTWTIHPYVIATPKTKKTSTWTQFKITTKNLTKPKTMCKKWQCIDNNSKAISGNKPIPNNNQEGKQLLNNNVILRRGTTQGEVVDELDPTDINTLNNSTKHSTATEYLRRNFTPNNLYWTTSTNQTPIH